MNLDIEAEKTRLLAFRWCEIAVDGSSGVTVDDVVYRAVTEGRDPGPRYSSCPDLADWLLRRLGVVSPWINREEVRGQGKFAWGMSVSMLAGKLWGASGCCPTARKPHDGERLLRGDIAIVWNHPQGHDAHVFVVDDWNTEDGIAYCWDYGGGAMKPEHYRPGMIEGRRTQKHLKRLPSGAWMVGTNPPKRLQCVIPLLETLEHCRAAGETVAADDPDEWLRQVRDAADTEPAPPP